jgi:hypothetical protein
MAHLAERPASWTGRYPELGTGLVSYEDSVSPEFAELEREAIFRRAWLNKVAGDWVRSYLRDGQAT